MVCDSTHFPPLIAMNKRYFGQVDPNQFCGKGCQGKVAIGNQLCCESGILGGRNLPEGKKLAELI